MLKNKDFKTIYYSTGNQYYQRKVVPQVNLVIPPVVNRLISVGELRAVAIKHLVELSVEHEFFCHYFSKRKTCHEKIRMTLYKLDAGEQIGVSLFKTCLQFVTDYNV